jgi:hypothetical protein
LVSMSRKQLDKQVRDVPVFLDDQNWTHKRRSSAGLVIWS